MASFYGIIITNEKGIILSYNDYSSTLLNSEIVIGTPLKTLNKVLSTINFEFTKIDNNIIYIINNKNSENLFDLATNNINLGIFLTNKSGELIYCNDSFSNIYGLDKKDILGKNLNLLVKNNYADNPLLDLVIKTKKQISYNETTESGKTITITMSPTLNSDNNIRCIIGTCKDISEVENLKTTLLQTKGELQKYKTQLNESTETPKHLNIDFQSPTMKRVYDLLDAISNKDITVLLLGKSGTGKTSLAKRIHKYSFRKNGPFITINCASIPDSLMESELFGYAKGAFTGASSKGKLGMVELANKGTLFLDEIGELPFQLQSKLLELVQERTFTPIGNVKPKEVDVRIIAATNKDLLKLVNEGKFREDLYYRIAVAVVNTPPIAERPEDVELLLSRYLDFFNYKHNLNVKFSKITKDILCNYTWPGNIRELEHLIEFLVLRTQGKVINPEDLPTTIINSLKSNSILMEEKSDNTTLKKLLEKKEGVIIQEYYSIYNSSYKLAKVLSISQSTASRLISKYCKKY
jgi:PAS domain S-box-containing protein